MPDRTGLASGSVSAIVYFENAAGEISLPPSTSDAWWLYHHARNRLGQDCALKNRGWQWREARTLAEVDALQKRLQELELAKLRPKIERHQEVRELVQKRVAGSLYQRLISSGSSDLEKEFIRTYLDLQLERRDKYRALVEQTIGYLHVREMDAHTSGTDRIKD